MALVTLGSLFLSILYSSVIFYLGKILSNSDQLRSFLGLTSENENKTFHAETASLIEATGKLLMLIAIVSAVVSLITTLLAASRF